MLNRLKSHKRFWPFLATFRVTVSPKIYTIGRIIIIYQRYFLKLLYLKKIWKWKSSQHHHQHQQQQHFQQFPGLGFAADKNTFCGVLLLFPCRKGETGRCEARTSGSAASSRREARFLIFAVEVGARLILEIQNWLVGLLTWKGEEASSRKNPPGFIPFLVSKVGRRRW